MIIINLGFPRDIPDNGIIYHHKSIIDDTQKHHDL